jgi:NAD-dependent SIR2 family protein deacetylase
MVAISRCDMETTKCPVCNATIKQGVTIFGNCKSHLLWKEGIPKKYHRLKK